MPEAVTVIFLPQGTHTSFVPFLTFAIPNLLYFPRTAQMRFLGSEPAANSAAIFKMLDFGLTDMTRIAGNDTAIITGHCLIENDRRTEVPLLRCLLAAGAANIARPGTFFLFGSHTNLLVML